MVRLKDDVKKWHFLLDCAQKFKGLYNHISFTTRIDVKDVCFIDVIRRDKSLSYFYGLQVENLILEPTIQKWGEYKGCELYPLTLQWWKRRPIGTKRYRLLPKQTKKHQFRTMCLFFLPLTGIKGGTTFGISYFMYVLKQCMRIFCHKEEREISLWFV